MAEVKLTSLGAAKPDSEVFKRGYTINVNTGKPAGKPAEKPAEKKEEEK